MINVLCARNLTKHYGDAENRVPVIQDVTLRLQQGEISAIVGPSGSGKTTLLHILGGLERPTSGEVWWGDHAIHDLDARRLPQLRAEYVGFVFQDPHLLPELSAVENVVLPGRIQGKIEYARGHELLEAVGMADRMHALPATLSGGERQRVAVARALYRNPPVLLADEPTGSLDQATSARVFELLISIARNDGRSVILVTHDLRLASHVDRTYSLDRGELIEEGVDDASQTLGA